MGVAVGGVSPPPPFFFSPPGCREGGGVLWVWFSALSCPVCVVVPAACLGLGRLGLRPPSAFRLDFVFFFSPCPCGGRPATSPVGCAPLCLGCPFLCPFGGRVVRVGRCFLLGVAGLGRVVPQCSLGGPVGVVFRVPWLGALPACCGVGARLRGCVSAPPPPFSFFPVGRWMRVPGWVGVPPFSVFFSGGVPCSSLRLSLGGARTGRHCVWLPASLLVLWVAAGRAPASWVGWVMYKLGPVACPVGLGAGSTGWVVAPAGFVRSWVRGGEVPPVSTRPCGARSSVAGLMFWWQFVRAERRRPWGEDILSGVWRPLARVWRPVVALSHGCGRLSFLSGLCGGLLGFDPRLASLAFVLWCAFVRCAVFCWAVPCCSVLYCGALCSVVPCRAVFCRGVSLRGVAGCAMLRRAALCCAVLCPVVGYLVAVPCTAVRCASVCRVASF